MRKLLFAFFCLTTIMMHASSVWEEGSQWDVYFSYMPTGTDSAELEILKETYRLLPAEGNYMALEKTVSVDDEVISIEVQGYIRNDGDSLIYVRPVLEGGSIGDECLLYDFRKPFEYGRTVRYGVMGGEVRELPIDWQNDTLDYYMINNGDTHCLPEWEGIIYQYGYIGGPMKLFLLKAAPGRTRYPKPTNISHVIFSSKGGKKITCYNDEDDIVIPYDNLLANGTTWECLAVSTRQHELNNTYTIQVKGDTIIGKRHCKQIYSPEYDIQRTLFEEGRKVYIVNGANQPEVVLDFNLQAGDRLDDVTIVMGEWYQENLGNNYRIITIDTGIDCGAYFPFDPCPWCYHLIEGIGASKDEFLAHRFINKEDTFSYLLKCWKDGTLVYQVSGYDSVDEAFPDNEPHAIYDLQGHRLDAIKQRGIYIVGTKKVLIQ